MQVKLNLGHCFCCFLHSVLQARTQESSFSLSLPSLIPCIQSISESCHSRLQNLSRIKFLIPLPLCHSIPSNQATIICHMIYSNCLLTGLSDSILNPSQSILHAATSDPLQINSYLSLAQNPLMVYYTIIKFSILTVA